MDFQLTEDQRAFADMAQGLFADYCSDDQLRAHDVSGAPFMQELWRQCVAAGLHSIAVPDEHGGLGLGMTELMAVLEQQGRALALVPLWEQQLAAATLARFGGAGAQTALPALLEGEIAAVSLAGLAQSRGCTLQLQQDGTGWQLQGLSPAVPLAGSARHALLVAQASDGPRLVWLDLQTPGVSRAVGQSQHHQEVADLYYANVALSADAVLPPAAVAWLQPRALAALAALQMGVTAQQLRRTVAYVSERKQFDRAIGSFQLVAGQMADGHIALEALRSSVWQLVYRLDADLGALPQAHAVRALANDTGHRVGHMAQHVHGGMGVDVTYPIHRFLYWSRALAVALGGTEHHLAALGDWLADNDNLGWKYDLAEDEL
ncbi:MAG: acyl-CoA/acyl-ACP dehydrogenase [Proteobacteria bacterium]|nr:acyl-CoA/acyl-ACP dehydrogenase [Pseudomonadota bacterium]MBS0494497.1 acyl-CoA/acyl-ACP dehydrogenase [Pseudomonadota bacterium]